MAIKDRLPTEPLLKRVVLFLFISEERIHKKRVLMLRKLTQRREQCLIGRHNSLWISRTLNFSYSLLYRKELTQHLYNLIFSFWLKTA